jgi:1-acyl-sn-glycerol-3-phosphate acyltransferase
MAIFGFTTTVSGLENMPGGKNVILVSNHPTFFDPILLNNALPGFYNFIVFATMLYTPLTIFAIRFLGLIIRLYGNFLSGSKAIINAAKAINEGDSFILFPTEFIVPEGNIDKIRPGVYKIFEATSAVILPVYIKSGIKFTFLLKPFRSNVIIGKPLDRQHILYGRDNAIKQAVESLRPEVQ